MRRAICFAILACLVSTSLAQDNPSPQEKNKKAQAIERRIIEAFRDKKFEEAAGACRELLELFPAHSPTHYNLACALARLGKADDAFASLGKAVEHGYADPGHMQKDDDLATLRADKRFGALLARAKANRKEAIEKLPLDKGADIPGIKTIEGNPEDGLRYRLRLSEKATADKPHRLIVWLHPSGGSMNSVVERLVPQLAEHGFALLVLTQKQYAGWTEDDASRLVEKTLPDVAKHKELDAKRPVLLGYSAGGQIALELWYADPSRWGGLVLDAAYPIRAENGKFVPRDPPRNEGIQKTPLFVLVGDKDGGAGLWKNLAPKWRDAKVPLTIQLVEGKGHTWLFGKAEIALLGKWLDDVAAGKLPQGPTEEKSP
jgi:predicted esterase